LPAALLLLSLQALLHQPNRPQPWHQLHLCCQEQQQQYCLQLCLPALLLILVVLEPFASCPALAVLVFSQLLLLLLLLLAL
jgi:hypothetical protein